MDYNNIYSRSLADGTCAFVCKMAFGKGRIVQESKYCTISIKDNW